MSTDLYTLSLHDALPIFDKITKIGRETPGILNTVEFAGFTLFGGNLPNTAAVFLPFKEFSERTSRDEKLPAILADRKSTRLNSSHRCISYAVFCLIQKK